MRIHSSLGLLLRVVSCVTLVSPILLLAGGCTDFAAQKYPELAMTITKQPVEDTDLDQVTLTFRVDRIVPEPGPLANSQLRFVVFQVNWYNGLSPLGAPDTDSLRRSETFYFYGGSVDQATYTSTYAYPYKDPSGAPMECTARIFWTDSKGEHQVDSSTISLSSAGS